MELVAPPAKIGVRGWVEVALVSREGKVIHHHAQPNLILNKGLDYIMSSLQLENIHYYIAVGTGSTAPSPTQTALANEIARTNATLDLGPDLQVTALANGHYRISRTRAFDYNQANGNLTEFGGSESSTDSSGVNTRELFRDSNGTPIVITKTSSERLVITYHIEVQFSPVVVADWGTLEIKDNNGAVVDTRLVRHTFGWHSGSDSTGDLTFISSVLKSSGYYTTQTPLYPGGDLYTTQASMAYLASTPDAFAGSDGTTLAYTGGSFYRDFQFEIGPETSNRTVYGWVLGRRYLYGYGVRGYVTAFVNPDGTPNPFTKSKDYRMRVTTRLTIARQ